MNNFISIKNAREHNLKNISLDLPRDSMIVFTGVSGSGKSSLAFDTIFMEGQRRYIASLSAYARQFIQNIDRPSVDKIDGLSPTICIDQKSVGRNPRSTVGTITEIYDFLRLLFSRLGIPHCPNGHGPIYSQTAEVIIKQLYRERTNQTLLIMAPTVVDRKGEYRKELKEYREAGFIRILVNGKLHRLEEEIALARYEKHTIEIVLDRVTISPENQPRITDSVYKAVDLTGGKVSFLNYAALNQSKETQRSTYTSKDYTITNIKNACQVCGIGIKEMEPKMFSFNSLQDACSNCQGLGYLETFDPKLMIQNSKKPVFEGALSVLNNQGNVLYTKKGHGAIKKIYQHHSLSINTPWEKIPELIQKRILTGKPKNDSINFDCTSVLQRVYDQYRISHFKKFQRQNVCSECEGSSIGLIARHVTLGDRNIYSYNQMQIKELFTHLDHMEFSNHPEIIWKPIVKEIRERLFFLINVGLDYLTLNRKANTLSGGEAQRIRLAAQVGSGLEGCLYVLDEPSIGLHSIDNQKLIQTLKQLQSKNNSLIVIEHDEETMLAADHLVEIGPGAGIHGGNITFNSIPKNIFSSIYRTDPIASIDYLIGKKNIPLSKHPPTPTGYLTFYPLNRFNLKNLKVTIPLGVVTVLTGVSGSGKSTLLQIISETIHTKPLNSKEIKSNTEKNKKKTSSKVKSLPKESNTTQVLDITIEGLTQVSKIIEINQRPIGRTPRSNPATYTNAWTTIRDLFSQTKEARLQGYGKSRFSFNLKGGRCEECQGSGVNRIETQFFSPIEVVCEACDGKRFNRNTLSVHYKGKTIYDVLEMTIEEALDFFISYPKIKRILNFLNNIGLGYMKLGQNSTTLSGGEAQRIKLTSELSRNTPDSTLYLLDEPTTGLHFSDIEKLLQALRSLVNKGNSVVIIEHNPEVIKCADHIIEMGPLGGEGGGNIIFAGNLINLSQASSATGKVMKQYLQRQKKKEKGYYLKKKNQSQLFPKTSIKTPSQSTASNKKNHAFYKPHSIIIRGLKKHNLKNIDLDLPKNKIIVFTGVSGSGKTSIAMDSIYTEGQRKYLESLSTYVRRFLGRLERPPVEVLENLSPTIAIDQKKNSNNPRSTIATQTEIYDNLRNLYANVGVPHCPTCDQPLHKHSETMAAKDMLATVNKNSGSYLILAPLYHYQDQGFLVQKKNDFPNVVKALEEGGFTRLLINGGVVKINEINTSWKKKIQEVFLIIDRLELISEHEERIISALEKAYQIGSQTAAFLSYNVITSKNNSSYNNKELPYQWYTNYDSCWRHNHVIKEKIIPRYFSFNHHLGACNNCSGIGKSSGLDEKKLFSQPNLPFPQALNKNIQLLLGENRLTQLKAEITLIENLYSNTSPHLKKADFTKPWGKLGGKEKNFILWGKYPFSTIENLSKRNKKKFFLTLDPSSRITNTPEDKKWKGLHHELIPVIQQKSDNFFYHAYNRGISENFISSHTTCPICSGARLKPYLLKFKINGLSIDDVCNLSISEAYDYFITLSSFLQSQSPILWQIAQETVEEITFRIKQMLNLGIDYLTLNRGTGSLSGGEMQRIRISTQIGNQLRDVIYVLDEPTIGLHEHDNQKLIQVISYLRDLGNTILIIEHDAQIIKAADFIVDIGPEAGERGGQVVYAGPNKTNLLTQTSFYDYISTHSLSNTKQSISCSDNQKKIKNIKNNNKKEKTKKPITTNLKITQEKKFYYPRDNFFPFTTKEPHLFFSSLSRNNVYNLSLPLPLNKLVGISGISGSGKSSLLEGMADLLEKKINIPPSAVNKNKFTHKDEQIEGKPTVKYLSNEQEKESIPITQVRIVDQTPISLNRRSTLVSYMDLYTDIRKIFSQSRTAKMRGYNISYFSFNSEKGRCPKCDGLGEEEIEMHFISNVSIVCEECHGKRFKKKILEVYFKGKNIYEILEMTFQESYDFFYSFQSLQKKITRLLEAGLGYLKLGFKTSLLSGGERQRLKIAHQLAMDNPQNTLYFLDEPTTGLHFRDIEKLIKLLEKLIVAGGSVVTIEHNIEFLRSLDHLIDLGPGSGHRGGRLVASGNPRVLGKADNKEKSHSFTLKYL